MLPVMRSSNVVNGVLFCLMLAGMLLYSLPPAYTFARGQTNALELFVDGRLLRDFERFYDKRFFLRDFSVRQWANLQYLLFEEGASGVVLGRDGWLFSNQEYHVPNDVDANLDKQIARIAAIRDRLEQAGKRLIVLPVPMKIDVYAEHAVQQPEARAAALHERFVGQLAARRISVADPRERFLAERATTDLFLRNDTHWSPAGARLAAFELARMYPELVGGTPHVSTQVGDKALLGDLTNFLRFDPQFQPAYFEPVPLALYETVPAEAPEDAASLFGEVAHDLVLVGTSYTHIDDWNFTGFLKEALSQDLLSIAVEARGPFQAMDDYLASNLFAEDGPRTVIWEFPVRTVLVQRITASAANQ